VRVNEQVLARTAERCRERGIVIPTFAQMRDPSSLPAAVTDRLRSVGLWDVDPLNLFRITWKNEPVEHGGGFNDGQLPSSSHPS
jgi:cysteine synthase A